jgi:antitoxin ParD1/3/4
MNISLTPELENMVNEKVQSGLYNSASEVMREALRLLKEQDDLKRLRLDELRREIMIGVEQIRRGEYSVYNSGRELAEEIIRDGERKLASRREAGQ